MIKKTQKKIFILFLGLVLLINNVFLVAAQECSSGSAPASCNQTPDAITEYISKIQGIINSVNAEKNNSSGIEKFGKTLIDSAYVTAAIMSGMPKKYGGDFFANIKLLFNSKAAQRDRDKLSQIDKKISKKIRELAEEGVFFNKIKKEDISKIKSKLSEFPIISDVEIKVMAQYGDVLEVVWALNTVYKNLFLEVTQSNKDSQSSREGLKKLVKDMEGIIDIVADKSQFESYKKSLADEYKCSTGSTNNCPKETQEFKKNIESILESGKESGIKSLEKISESWARLEEALKDIKGSMNLPTYEKRKEKLLNQYLGSKAEDLLDCKKDSDCLWGIGKAWNDLKEKVINPARDMMDKTGEYIEQQLSTDEAKVGTDKIMSGKVNKKYINEERVYEYSNIIKGIISSHSRKTGNITMEDPTSRTRKYPEISEEVYNSINIIGSKEKEKGIVWNLGEACEEQCTNMGGKCRYE